MAALSSIETYLEWKHKHWSPQTMHDPTNIEKAVFERIHGTKNRLVDIIDKPTKEDIAKYKQFYDNDTLYRHEYELLRVSGKRALLVWASFKK